LVFTEDAIRSPGCGTARLSHHNTVADAEVSAKYHELRRIEENFRVSKTDLKARPVFARRRSRSRHTS
jgi:hypothetical protein